MPLSVLLVLMDGKVFPTTPTEQGLVNLRHVLEEPLDVAPLPAQLTLLPHLARLDPPGIVQLHVHHLRPSRVVARQTRGGAVCRRLQFQTWSFKSGSEGKIVIYVHRLKLAWSFGGGEAWESHESLGEETATGAAREALSGVSGDVRGGGVLRVAHLVADQTYAGSVGQARHPLSLLVEGGDVAPHVLDGGDGVPFAAHQALMGLLAPGPRVGPGELTYDLLHANLASQVIDERTLRLMEDTRKSLADGGCESSLQIIILFVVVIV